MHERWKKIIFFVLVMKRSCDREISEYRLGGFLCFPIDSLFLDVMRDSLGQCRESSDFFMAGFE